MLCSGVGSRCAQYHISQGGTLHRLEGVIHGLIPKAVVCHRGPSEYTYSRRRAWLLCSKREKTLGGAYAAENGQERVTPSIHLLKVSSGQRSMHRDAQFQVFPVHPNPSNPCPTHHRRQTYSGFRRLQRLPLAATWSKRPLTLPNNEPPSAIGPSGQNLLLERVLFSF